MIIIETEKLSKIYVRDVIDTEFGRLSIRLSNRKTVALKDLDLNIQQGEIFGLLGPNGAGKTTAMKILMGIHYPSSGSARIMGKPLGDKGVKSKIGFLPENPYFYDYLKGWEFLDFYGQLYGMSRAERRAKTEKLLDQVGLTHAANIPLRGFSKGMNQRIGLAQALMSDPELVVLDEPQSGLDPLGRKEVRDIIHSLKEQGKTVLFSSHILSDAEMICDRVGILYRGELKSIGPVRDLLSEGITEWEIVLRNIGDDFRSRWEQKVMKCTVLENDLWISSSEEDQTNQIISDAVREGGILVSLTPRRESLEDYFIREVGKGGGA
jgi:ABC-2 type transport system ATP-binding protein